MTNKIEIELSLSDALAGVDKRPDDSMLDMMASAFLVPKEYQFVDSKGCLGCGSSDLERLTQRALPDSGHPDPSAWPYDSPCGDALLFRCKQCGGQSEFVFWFRKEPNP